GLNCNHSKSAELGSAREAGACNEFSALRWPFGDNRAISIRTVHVLLGSLVQKRSKPNDEFAGSLAIRCDTAEALSHLFQVRRLNTQPLQPGLCSYDQRRDRVDDFVGLCIEGTAGFHRGLRRYVAFGAQPFLETEGL